MIKVEVIANTKWHITEYDEDIMSYCARVSNPKNQENFESSDKLLKYCIKHGHWSVFEMANVVMSIKAPRDITRQILRHRSFHFQEFSQRYADPTEMDPFFRECRFQDNKNRQNSIENDSVYHDQKWDELQSNVYDLAIKEYKEAIYLGIAKEQARALLPEGITMSHIYMNGTLRSWIHYCKLRMGLETQKEHRTIASMCWKELVELYPVLGEMNG
jgi:thymidylate synthase (FAD)